MAQSSVYYATARTKSLTARLITRERLERMLEAETADHATQMLYESGYGSGMTPDVLKAAEEELQQAYSYVRAVSPNRWATDAFLLKGDCYNLKLFFKAQMLDQDPLAMTKAMGTMEADKLMDLASRRFFGAMPENIGKAAAKVCRLLDGRGLTVQQMECMLDSGCFADMQAYAAKSGRKEVIKAVQTQADMLNLVTFLRVRKSGQGIDTLMEGLLPGGAVRPARFVRAFTASDEDLVSALGMAQYASLLRPGLEAMMQSGTLSVIERIADDVVLALFRRSKHEMDSVLPLVGYLIAKERESQAVRLVILAKRNNIPAARVWERLRELYA